MKRPPLLLLLALLLSVALAPAQLLAQSEPGYYTLEDQDQAQYQQSDDLLYPEELDDLLAAIALYPDPLIAQILPAATFVDQIHEAAAFVRYYGNTSRIDYQPWDISVRAVAHYPQVIYMMDREYQWTASLGQAFIEQPQDVMDAIQRLRRYARDEGNLYSTPQQLVIFDGDLISIVPAQPQYVYVPVYDPYVVYVEPYYPTSPYITFSIGFTIGPWLNRDCDWREHRVYYHGWRGGGWIGRARPLVRDRRGIYINRRAATITVNQRVVQRDTRVFRRQLRVETERHREEGRMPPVRSRIERPGKQLPQRPGVTEKPRAVAPRPGGGKRTEPWVGRVPAPAPAPRGTSTQTAPAPGAGTQPPAVLGQPPARHPRNPMEQRRENQPQQPPATNGKKPEATNGRGAEGENREQRRGGPRPANRPGVEAPAAPHQAPAAPRQTPAAPRQAPAATPKEQAAPAPAGGEPAREPRDYDSGQGRGRVRGQEQ